MIRKLKESVVSTNDLSWALSRLRLIEGEVEELKKYREVFLDLKQFSENEDTDVRTIRYNFSELSDDLEIAQSALSDAVNRIQEIYQNM